MIRSWILYVLATGVVLVFTILYGKQSGFLLYLLSVIFPVIYAVLTHVFGSRMKVEMVSDNTVCQKGDKKIWHLHFQGGRLLLQGNRACIWYKICTAQGKLCDRKKQVVFLEKEMDHEITYQVAHAGMYELDIEKIRIYSGFSLFYRSLATHLSDSFFVMPQYREDLVQMDPLPAQREGESDTFIQGKEGNDPSEILGFREYRQGDRKNRINWVATMKTGQLMVPEYGFPMACDIGILVDLEQSGEKKTEQVLEFVYALCVAIKEQGRNWYVIWEKGNSGKVERREIKKEEEIYEMLYRIAGSIGTHSRKLEDLYRQQYEDAFFSQAYFICDRNAQMAEETAEKLCAQSLKWMQL